MAAQPTTDDLASAVAGSSASGGSGGGSSILPVPYSLKVNPGSTSIDLTFDYDAAIFKGFSVRCGVADPPHDDVLDPIYLNAEGTHGEAKVTVTGLSSGTLYYLDAAAIGVDSTVGTRSASISTTTTGGGGFVPSDIGGLAVWLDLDSMVVVGSAVTSWTDQSGNGQNGTPHGSATYVSSPPGINVTAGGYFQIDLPTTPITAPADLTLFVVATVAAAGTDRYLAVLWTGSGDFTAAPNGYDLILIDAGKIYTYCSGLINVGGALTNSTTYGIGCVMDFVGSSQQLLANGATITNTGTPPSLSTMSHLYIGGGPFGGPWNGDLQMVLAYKAILTPTEIAQVKTYISTKYAAYSVITW